MKYIGFLSMFLLITLFSCNKKIENKIDLAGNWQFALDPSDKGVSEGWFNKVLSDTLTLPGSLTSNGKGDDITLGTQHQYELTKLLNPGKHRLTVCIDNRTKEIDPGVNSHSISDHTQTNWNGMIGQLYLEVRPLINIRNISVYPDIQNKRFKAKVKVFNPSERPVKAELSLKVSGAGTPDSKACNFVLVTGENILTMEYPMGNNIKLWNEFHPEIYKLTAVLSDQNSKIADTSRTTFGMREFKAVGKQLQINGQP